MTSPCRDHAHVAAVHVWKSSMLPSHFYDLGDIEASSRSHTLVNSFSHSLRLGLAFDEAVPYSLLRINELTFCKFAFQNSQ